MYNRLFIALMITLFASLSFAKSTNNECRQFNSDDVMTLSGEFVDVDRPNAKFISEDGTEYFVHLGPYWYWQQNDYEVTTNMPAEIKGEVMRVDGQYELYPWVIIQDGVRMCFSDNQGIPNWSRGRGNNIKCNKNRSN